MAPFEDKVPFQIIAEKELDSAIFRLYENRIYHVIFKKGERLTMDFVKEGYSFLDENGGGEFSNIYEFQSFTDIDPEVREWASSPSNNAYTRMDALVVTGLPQKLLADFYIRFNKPVKPTKVFNSIEKALIWIASFEE